MATDHRKSSVSIFGIALALSLICPGTAQSQSGNSPVTILQTLDLAGPASIRIPGNAGTVLRFSVKNMKPAGNYHFEVESRFIEQPPLDIASRITVAPPAGLPRCAELKNAILAAMTEKDIASAVDEAEGEKGSCVAGELDALNAAIALTRREVPGEYPLLSGAELVLTAKRIGSDGTIEDTWTLIVGGGQKGQWTTSYGFNFFSSDDKTYFSKEDPDNVGSFVITEKIDRKDLDFAPSIFFSYRSQEQRQSDVPFGLSVGLGFDLDNPVVFVGAGWDFGQNFTIVVGGLFSKRTRLDGRYTPGDILSTSLDSAQLTQETYGASPFLGFGFRFGSNPFSDGDGDE